MKINKHEFIKALEIVKPGLSNKELIEQSKSFAFMKDKVVTYNDEISVSHPIQGLNIIGAVNADELYRFLNKIKSEEIDFVQKDNQILIKAGRGKAGLVIESEIKLPLEEIEHSDTWHDLPKGFIEAIDFVKYCAGKDMSRPILTCLEIHTNGYVQASDSHRIAKYELVKEMPIGTILIPAATVQELVKAQPVQVAEGRTKERSSGWVHFKTEQGSVISCRVFNDEYPDTSTFFDIKGVKLNLPTNIQDIIDRATVFSKRDFQAAEKIIVTIENNRISIRAETETGSWFEEDANMKYKGSPISFMIAPYLLSGVLKETRTFTLSKDRMKFSGEYWEYLTSLYKTK